jgi:GNAT superfamily N-acetyltransferase
MKLTLEAFIGLSIEHVIPDLARLRMTVFREFPYLYEGSLEYEQKYLQTYLGCSDSLILVVRDGENIVGASSALPLNFEASEVQQPFLEHGFDPKTVLYLAESVLLPVYRGQGLGHQFFDTRETHAKAINGCLWTAFVPCNAPKTIRCAQPITVIWMVFGNLEGTKNAKISIHFFLGKKLVKTLKILSP